MIEKLVLIGLSFFAFYILIGFFFAIAFSLKGAAKIDDDAKGSSKGFHLIIIPGTMFLWPCLIKKWWSAS